MTHKFAFGSQKAVRVVPKEGDGDSWGGCTGVSKEGDGSSTRSIFRQMGKNGERGSTETMQVLMVKYDGINTFTNLSVLSKLYISI